MPGRRGSCGEINAENGPIAESKITSDITVSAGSPWHSIGVVMPLSFDPMVVSFQPPAPCQTLCPRLILRI
jgi:hypothetical protein